MHNDGKRRHKIKIKERERERELKKGKDTSPTITSRRRETSFRAQGDPESHLNLTRATINGKLRRQAE